MAEVRKKEKIEKYNIDEIAVKKNKKEEPKKVEKKSKKKLLDLNIEQYIDLHFSFRQKKVNGQILFTQGINIVTLLQNMKMVHIIQHRQNIQ